MYSSRRAYRLHSLRQPQSKETLSNALAPRLRGLRKRRRACIVARKQNRVVTATVLLPMRECQPFQSPQCMVTGRI